MTQDKNKQISVWLFALTALVLLMVVIGGLTRLSESGLSIVKWEPVKGALPPLNASDWQKIFSDYQQSPQYKQVNSGMTIQEFKGIFWLEYIHRLLGRLIGIAFLVPFLYFLLAKKIDKSLGLKLAGIFFLGGLQGFVGWYMVKSGLVNNPAVSHYRLALHLFIAFVIMGSLFLSGLSLTKQAVEKNNQKIKKILNFSYFITGVILLQVVLGALVAGSHSGLIYNTFPKMGDGFIPPDLFFLKPRWLNFFANHTMLQFQHRINAYFIFALSIILWRIGDKPLKQSGNIETRNIIGMLFILITCQFNLGVSTLLQQVPLVLASLHQTLAGLVFLVSLFINFRLYAINKPS